MSKVSLKKDFVDGEKLFAQQLNNNFSAIEAAQNEKNKIIWTGESTEIKFFKGETEEIENREIENGQLLYDTLTGETYLDDGTERLITGSGNVVAIGEEEPTAPATKLWVDTSQSGTVTSEVINTLEGNETKKAPSVNAVNQKFDDLITDLRGTLLWTNSNLNEDFAPQTIALDLTNYTNILIISKNRKDDDLHTSTLVIKGLNIAINTPTWSDTLNKDTMAFRRVYASNTGVFFSNVDCFGIGNYEGYDKDQTNILIPYQIIGFK